MTTGMTCGQCGGERTEVRDSRPSTGGIRRRRRCFDCGYRFTTYEYSDGDWQNRVVDLQRLVDKAAGQSAALTNLLDMYRSKGAGDGDFAGHDHPGRRGGNGHDGGGDQEPPAESGDIVAEAGRDVSRL